jgi:pyruvate ferredoxin oxidoreductase beta subunit
VTSIPLHVVAPGHRACAGCGLLVGARLAADRTGGRAVVANATGCLEVTTTAYPSSAWRLPWIHSVFGNAAAVATGVRAGLRARGIDVPVIAQAGDGGTADIGMQALSGMLERGDDVLFVCYDNEGYMNTGVQRSGLTPPAAATTTTPPGLYSEGNARPKKDLLAIVLAHRPAYAATASPAFAKDLEHKMDRALAASGPRFLHVLVPCPLGWRFASASTIELSRLAVRSSLFPLTEWIDGRLEKVKRAGAPCSVDDYLRAQGRFGHLFADDAGAAIRAELQVSADETARRLGLPAYGDLVATANGNGAKGADPAAMGRGE